MKTHTLKFAMLSVILLILAGWFVSCNGKEKSPKVCDVENPLTDLPWLEKIVNDENRSSGIYVNIFQCTYSNGLDGFYIEPCVNCNDYGAVLYNCYGTILLDVQGINYMTCFEEWNIKDLKLIWTNIK